MTPRKKFALNDFEKFPSTETSKIKFTLSITYYTFNIWNLSHQYLASIHMANGSDSMLNDIVFQTTCRMMVEASISLNKETNP